MLIISPDTEDKALVLLAEGTYRLPVDVIFPASHGLNGEDRTIQGLFEMAQIPYVDAGVLASRYRWIKVYTKIICGRPWNPAGTVCPYPQE